MRPSYLPGSVLVWFGGAVLVSQTRRLGVPLLSLALAAVAGTAGDTGAQAPPADRFEVIALQNVMVPARDGVRLATDVYLPAPRRRRRGARARDRGAHAVQQGHDRGDGWSTTSCPAATRSSSRTCAAGTGRRDAGAPSSDDGPDGADLLTWIGGQPWSSGQGGHRRHVVRRRHAARGGHHQRAGPRRHGAGGRHERTPATTASATTAPSSCAGSTGSSPWATRPGLRASAAGVAPSPNGRSRRRGRPSAPDAAARPRGPRRPRARVRARRCRSARAPRRSSSRPTTRRGWSRRCGTATTTPSGRTWARASSITSPSTRTCPSYHVTGWYDSWGTQVANLNYVRARRRRRRARSA